MTPEKLIGSDRAEDLTPDQVLELFSGAGGDDEIVQRLLAPGVFLLQGSRGTGKTMLLRVAYERMLREAVKNRALPVFVSFARYLATFNATAKQHPAYRPFQNWVFAKMLSAMVESALQLRLKIASDSLGKVPLDKYAGRLEAHYQDATVSDPARNAAVLGVSEKELLEFARLDQVQERMLRFLDSAKIESVTFFLDEAAQSFAEELQPEFFQLVRHLRHHRISVKAAIYPNTTNFGRDFDIGHDAILLPIERQIETSEGMIFFRELIKKRFAGSEFGKTLARSEVATSFLIKTSGGNPRWFIHLLSALPTGPGATIPAAQALVVAKQLPDNTLWPYLKKIRENLVSKRKYVDTALQLAQTLLEGVRDANRAVKRDALERPICYVAVSTHKTVPYRVHAAVKLLQYAGIVSSRGPKKITGRETAEMLLIHPAILVRENALFAGEANPPVDSIVSALTDPAREKFKEFTRNSPKLLDFREGEDVDHVTCAACGKEVPEHSKFCLNCGASIAQASPFAELLQRPTDQLELTPGIKQRVVADGRFPTVKSIVDASDRDLDSIPYIGTERVALIRYAAEEFLAG